jgi:DNA-binding transcriptional MerR regulator
MKTAREVCRAAGISRKALRVYRERKLLSPCQKSVQGYWLYGEDTLMKIRRIQLLKQLGFRLSEIRSLEKAPHTELLKSLAVKKQEAEKETEELHARIRRIGIAEEIISADPAETGLSEAAMQVLIHRILKENPDPQEE